MIYVQLITLFRKLIVALRWKEYKRSEFIFNILSSVSDTMEYA